MPAFVTLTLLLCPFFSVPVSNTPSALGDAPEVAVCGALSWLVNVIFVPTATVTASG